MKKKWAKKLLSMLCAASLAAAPCMTVLAEEETAETTAAEDLEYVELEWYLELSPVRPDFDMVMEKVNEYLKEKLNMNVNVHLLTNAEYKDKVPNMLRAGEDCGIVRVSGGALPYAVNARQGAFYPMNELLEKYGTGSKGLFSEDVWNSLEVDGNIYCVPNLKDNCYIMGYIYNEDLANELGIDMENIGAKNGRDLEETLLKAMEIRNEKHPEWEGEPLVSDMASVVFPYFFQVEQMDSLRYAVCNIPDVDAIGGYDPDTVYNLYATDEFREFCLSQQRLSEAGVYAYDYTEIASTVMSESSTLVNLAWGYTWIDEHLFSNEFSSKLVPFENIWTDSGNFTSSALAISANCANPERAMMLIELVNTDPYLATLFRFGIEGEHYTIGEDGKMNLEGTRNEDPSNPGWLYWYGDNWGNLTITNAPESYGGPDGIVFKKMLEYNNSAKLSAHMGFTFDPSSVENEITACANVLDEYNDLILGHYESADEVNAAFDEMNEKLTASGVDKIIAEAQSQIDAWNAEQGK
ncbi:ABC transporter substrate-binding protein [Blautia sp. HCP3S3_G3]|uniref:ABC transporter substrate-binding protein n=1 Tax=Blautia sp. HCP3S3_G3 TaxID=3438913 RepID=UPI003F8A4B52